MAYALTEGRIFTGDEVLSGHAVIVDNGLVQSVVPVDQLPSGIDMVALNGNLLAPGFIDVQVNGGGGALLNDEPSPITINTIGEAHRHFGTTGFLPTLITDTRDTMVAAIEAVREALRQKVPGVRGIHLEGPYLNTSRKGVHRKEVIREPEQDAIDLLCSLGTEGITLVTLAPERVPPGFIRELRRRGVLVSLGHTEASYDQVLQALEEGATCFTHLYNAMSPLNHRDPGAVGAALDDPGSWCGIIADGHHVHPASLRIAFRAKAKGKMMLVTDAMHTVGIDGDRFELQGRSLVRRDGLLATEDGVLAGSDLDMATAVRYCVNHANTEVEETLRMASLYPATFLGIDQTYGRIAPGYSADMVLLDKDFNVRSSWVSGS
ncbi:N-acetylglucosamine-6-phosphate deacetylase [Hahella ganghwensis]|uniref:N-acetylglucosamine-6-phosphate deacetylase n=1 Tax=Hahella ganghwensis TaxID=286420 RepID=UPI00037B2572|nr:N-acetylglucosamine-6-phosphate deacetylase [Hahella ganghwensis]